MDQLSPHPSITGTYGIAAIVPTGFGPANINQHSVKIETNDQIQPEYQSVFLNSDLSRPQLDRAVTGSSRFALDYPAIRNLRILYPVDKGEQRRLSAVVMAKLDKASALRNEADIVSAEMPKIPGAAYFGDLTAKPASTKISPPVRVAY